MYSVSPSTGTAMFDGVSHENAVEGCSTTALVRGAIVHV